MALVNLLRFNRDRGAVISDEEYWDIRFRKKLYCDNLHSLVNEKLSSRWHLEVVYGGVGYPSVHREVIERARAAIEKIGAQPKRKNERPLTFREAARIAFDSLQDVIRKRIDQKLHFYFGFTTADLHRGDYKKNGETYKIKNKKIIETARAFSTRQKTDVLLKSALDCKAAVFGYDPADGISAFYLSAENSICGFNYEGFDFIGSGKYASGLSLGQTFNTKNLKMRKAGFTTGEGLYELVASALLAGDHFKEVGGNLNFVLIDGKGRTPRLRYQEFFDETARLTAEIVRAALAKLLSRKDAVALIEKLVLEKKPFQQVEGELFRKVKDPSQLNFLLRGYKISELREISNELDKTRKRNK